MFRLALLLFYLSVSVFGAPPCCCAKPPLAISTTPLTPTPSNSSGCPLCAKKEVPASPNKPAKPAPTQKSACACAKIGPSLSTSSSVDDTPRQVRNCPIIAPTFHLGLSFAMRCDVSTSDTPSSFCAVHLSSVRLRC